MQVRFPKWDFSQVQAHWAPNIEFAQRWNATSLIPAYIEPYLMKVMQAAQPELDAIGAPQGLKRDIDIFIKQEMQHCRQHVKFNKRLHESGYEALIPLERGYEADYDRLLSTKSLQFNLAYCEAFEGMSALGLHFFGHFDKYLVGADPNAVALWQWHMAEEHEHRSVVSDVYHALYGHGRAAWLYRVAVLFYAARHIRSFQARAYASLMAKDRENMSAEEVRASIAREKAVARDAKVGGRETLFTIMRYDYDPAKRPAPPSVDECLRRYEKPAAQVAA